MTRHSLSVSRRTALPLRLLALLLSLCPSPAHGDTGPGDWWMFHHDPQHTGRSPFSGPTAPVAKVGVCHREYYHFFAGYWSRRYYLHRVRRW